MFLKRWECIENGWFVKEVGDRHPRTEKFSKYLFNQGFSHGFFTLQAKQSQLGESPAGPAEVPPPSKSSHQQHGGSSTHLLTFSTRVPAISYLSDCTTTSSDWPQHRGALLQLAEVPQAGWNRL